MIKTIRWKDGLNRKCRFSNIIIGSDFFFPQFLADLAKMADCSDYGGDCLCPVINSYLHACTTPTSSLKIYVSDGEIPRI